MTEPVVGDIREVKMGQVAVERAANSRVRAFGSMMVRDHSRINNELKMLADKKGVILPDSLDQSHQEDISQLSKKGGANFDKAYIDMMVKGHKKVISAFENAANIVQDSGLKAFINNTLPVIKMHLDSAQSIQNYLEEQR